MFKNDKKMQERLITSYKIMLDFYGMSLKDEKTGEVERNEKIFENRYHNLNTSSHNYLRITRILKCLGICGLEYLKKPWIKFLLTEVLKEKKLENTIESLFKYWLPTLRYETDLVEMESYAEELTGKKVSRKWYDKEKRNWSNVVFPDENNKTTYKEGDTFYNRDDSENIKLRDDLINIEPPRYRYYSSYSTDNSSTNTPVELQSNYPSVNYIYNYWNDSDNDSDNDSSTTKSSDIDDDDLNIDEDLDLSDNE
jgi:hypothetical protein